MAAALAAAPEATVAVVHDAARPLVTPELVRRCLDALEGVDCAFAAARVTDTVHEGEDELIERSLDRSRLWAAQTPQVVRADVLRRRCAAGGHRRGLAGAGRRAEPCGRWRPAART